MTRLVSMAVKKKQLGRVCLSQKLLAPTAARHRSDSTNRLGCWMILRISLSLCKAL